MPTDVPENGEYTDQDYKRVKSLGRQKPAPATQNQGPSQAQTAKETTASEVRQPIERKANTREANPQEQARGHPTQAKKQVDIIMAYTGKTAGKKMTKQLDGMTAKQLQALAAEMSRRMQKPEGSPGEPKEWRKRLHHINRAIKDRTLTKKPGNNAMENLKKRLARTKNMPMDKRKGDTGIGTTNKKLNQPTSHAQIRPDATA